MAGSDSHRTALLASATCLVVGVACGWWLRGDPAPQIVAVESAALAKSPVALAPSPAASGSSAGEDSIATPIPFATAIGASLDDRDPLSRGIRLREIIRRLCAADLPAAVGQSAQFPAMDRWQIIEMLGSRWGEVDPRAGIAFADRLGGDDESIRRALIPRIVARWTALDPGAVTGWIKAKPHERSRKHFISDVVEELSRSDPTAALELLQQRPGGELDPSGYQAVFRNWAEQDPAAAASAAVGLKTWQNRNNAFATLAGSWVTRDPEGALRWAGQIMEPEIRNAVMVEFMRVYARNQPESALAWVQARGIEFMSAETGGGGIVKNAIAALSGRDPKSAASFLAQIPAGDVRNEASEALMRGWMNTDAAAALAWVQNIPEGAFRSTALDLAMSFWVEQDGKAALDWLARDPSSVREGWVLGNSLREWANHTPDEAMAWVLAQTDEKVLAAVSATTAGIFAEVDPERAAELFVKNSRPRSNPDFALYIALTWAKRDAAAAARWAQSLQQNESRMYALKAIAGVWAVTDSTNAEQWIQQLPLGSMRDSAVEGFVRQVLQRNPTGAIELLKTVGNVAARQAMFEELATNWVRSDPESAKRWIRTTGEVSTKTKKELLEPN